jgi:hypothetical protein
MPASSAASTSASAATWSPLTLSTCARPLRAKRSSLRTESRAQACRERAHQRRVVRADEPGPGPGAEALTLRGDPPAPRLGEDRGTREPGTTRPEVASPRARAAAPTSYWPHESVRGPGGALPGAAPAGLPMDGRPARSTRAGPLPDRHAVGARHLEHAASAAPAAPVDLHRREPPLQPHGHAHRKRRGLLGARGEDRSHEHPGYEERDVSPGPGPSQEGRTRQDTSQASERQGSEPSHCRKGGADPQREDREHERTDPEVLPAPVAHPPPPPPPPLNTVARAALRVRLSGPRILSVGRACGRPDKKVKKASRPRFRPSRRRVAESPILW